VSVPPWTTSPSIVWIADHPGFDPRVPIGATVISPEDAEAWLASSPPCDAIEMLRARGATAIAAPDAPREVRKLATRLRARLAVCSVDALAEVADDLGALQLASALRSWPAGTEVSLANLSSAAAGPRGQLDDVARLLLALEHL
jgi:hypothetical protein